MTKSTQVKGYSILSNDGTFKERLYAYTAEGRCYRTDWIPQTEVFCDHDFTECLEIPADAEFIGHYPLKIKS